MNDYGIEVTHWPGSTVQQACFIPYLNSYSYQQQSGSSSHTVYINHMRHNKESYTQLQR
jgi:hypothetical protein